MGKLIYCYWAPRGLGEPAKMLLAYGSIDYEHRIIKTPEEWYEQKYTLGFDFPNLPYLIEGDVKLTESWAIYKYIAKKIGLVPTTEQELMDSDVIQGAISDFRSNFSNSCYRPEFYSLVPEIRKKQVEKIGQFEKILQKRKYMLGEKLTYLDFALYETFDQQRLFFGDIFDSSPNIQAYMKRFESLDKIAAHFASDNYSKFPITGPIAIWGGKKTNDKKQS